MFARQKTLILIVIVPEDWDKDFVFYLHTFTKISTVNMNSFYDQKNDVFFRKTLWQLREYSVRGVGEWSGDAKAPATQVTDGFCFDGRDLSTARRVCCGERTTKRGDSNMRAEGGAKRRRAPATSLPWDRPLPGRRTTLLSCIFSDVRGGRRKWGVTVCEGSYGAKKPGKRGHTHRENSGTTNLPDLSPSGSPRPGGAEGDAHRKGRGYEY